MPKLKAGHISPTSEEDAAITKAAMSDPDSLPFTDDEWEAVRSTVRRPGRPPVTVRRPAMTMRVDADVLEHLRASGKGWQTRVNALLRKAVKSGQL
ncbi:MAG TPA: BrnA antitoxin family protein [Castellaniella sp.]|uniref:BrnA antitoxin family protein n=1 Tax=Castellaniella sp. TaxID=1955812 RepID=UPI002EEFBBDA